MSDVRQKAKDLLKLATHEGTGPEESKAATTQLLKLIEKYDLLSAGGVPIDVPASTLKDTLASFLSNPDFMDDVANRLEKFASGFDRVMAAGKRVKDHVNVAAGEPPVRRRRGR